MNYNPSKFEEIIGNKTIVNSLKLQLQTLPISPILFTGQYGAGKTTLAYIVAKEFGAKEQNILERDCVHFSKVEQMRELLEDILRPSLFEEKTVLIFDEIHDLSDKAIGALKIPTQSKNLKNHILFIGCTNKPEKIKDDAFLSRFISYRVSSLLPEESLSLIDIVTKIENIKLPKWLKALIVEKSQGVPRNILQNISKVKNGNLTEEEANYLLELTLMEEDKDIFDLFRVLLSKKFTWENIITHMNSILKTKTPNTIKMTLMNFMSNRIIYPSSNLIERRALYDIYKEFSNLNSNLDKADLIMCLHIFCDILGSSSK